MASAAATTVIFLFMANEPDPMGAPTTGAVMTASQFNRVLVATRKLIGSVSNVDVASALARELTEELRSENPPMFNDPVIAGNMSSLFLEAELAHPALPDLGAATQQEQKELGETPAEKPV